MALAALQSEAAIHNPELDLFRESLSAGNADAVVSYYDMVMDRSEYPDGFPQEYRIAFSEESKQLVVEVRLPTIADIVPVT